MKVLITGATGFVGSWLTRRLLDLGHSVRVLSRSLPKDLPFSIAEVEHVSADLTSQEKLDLTFANVDTVFHLAGVVGYSKAMRKEMHETNVEGTRRVVQAALNNRCRRLIHMSSVVAVGAGFSKNEILNESSLYNVGHLDLGYFETKRQAEELVLNSVREKGLPAVIVNPSTIYGPGDAKKGSRKMQVKVARNKLPFYTSGGVNVIHIDDVLSSVIKAWEVGQIGERYILAGENITIETLFQWIAESANVSAPKFLLPNSIVFALGRAGDWLESRGQKGPINSENAWTSTLFHWFDNSKARRELNLSPKPAKQAIAESVRWMQENNYL